MAYKDNVLDILERHIHGMVWVVNMVEDCWV